MSSREDRVGVGDLTNLVRVRVKVKGEVNTGDQLGHGLTLESMFANKLNQMSCKKSSTMTFPRVSKITLYNGLFYLKIKF